MISNMIKNMIRIWLRISIIIMIIFKITLAAMMVLVKLVKIFRQKSLALLFFSFHTIHY